MTDRPQHTYPSEYGPDSHWSVAEAWAILDDLPVGQLTDDQRFLAAGRIAGTLLRVASPQGRHSAELLHMAKGAYHALRSYEFGNGSADLARTMADNLEQALRRNGVQVKP
jgi:hypothetical protein